MFKKEDKESLNKTQYKKKNYLEDTKDKSLQNEQDNSLNAFCTVSNEKNG